MSLIHKQSTEMISTSEMFVTLRYFKRWLERRNVVYRTTAKALLKELDEFNYEMHVRYAPEEINGILLDSYSIDKHVDNILITAIAEGHRRFYNYAKSLIPECGRERITIPKFLKQLDIFVEKNFNETIETVDSERLQRL